MSQFLPKLFRWVFAVLAGLMALGAVCIVVLMLIGPVLPPGAHFGPLHGDIAGQPATFALQSDGADGQLLSLNAFRGNIAVNVDKPAGVVEVLKRYGLPLALVYTLFFAALFEVLRRLFRNVERGASFTPQTVRLVQIVGGGLIVFAFVSSIGESWFAHAMYGYLAEHTQFAISGTTVHLPPVGRPHFIRFPLGNSAFYTGLLVLALAEVFRQGLVLQRDNDLTV
ncbi:MAG: DUF2975 domain-containing protein [Alphaproteobacteria bacterium]|nr:DUF2975 domain-containing protein [Alphaproteobacteria bacterium]